MKKFVKVFILTIALLGFCLPTHAAFRTYWAAATSGGTTGAMDAIDGNQLNDGDKCVVLTTTKTLFYHLSGASGAAESGDEIIAPDANPGTKRWIRTEAFIGIISLLEKSADPTEPAEGECVIWMSDGTGKGDDGDVMIASQAGGTTTYATLFDHSAGGAW